ncbi:hypothetical protein ES705_42733 [subsurface metagenome]
METKEGYVCRTCGIVLEIQKLEYHKPYNNEILQYAKLGTTQIGSIRERFQNLKSVQLEKLNKLNSIGNNEQAVLLSAKCEKRRIINTLDLPKSMSSIVINKFKKFRECLRPGTKYRTPEKLIPITIYYVCKSENISINEAKLLEVSKITKKEFNSFKLQIQNYIPEYKERDRKEYIIQKILEVSEHFKLGMEFYYQAKHILYKLWGNINNTKDDVIAGLVSSISLLCAFKNSEVTVSLICTRLGIKMSTIQSQVKKRIFEQFKISGFTTLIKSTDLLQKVMNKMGLLKYGTAKLSEEVITPDIIEVRLGGGVPIHCHIEDYNCFLYALRQGNNEALIVSLRPCIPGGFFSGTKSNNLITVHNKDAVFELELLKYVTGKGPPLDQTVCFFE